MTVAEFKQITESKLNKLSITELKKVALTMNNNFGLPGEILFDTALDLLMDKMEENDFISFCDEL